MGPGGRGPFSAQLAYGNVRQIRKSLESWLARVMGVAASPSAWIRDGLDGSAGAAALDGFKHRLHDGNDLVALGRLLAESWRRFGSLGAHLASRLEPGHRNFAPALDGLLTDWKEWHQQKTGRPVARALGHLLAAPAQGSCCKRWCMLLRWMGRKDEVDLGLWMDGSPLLAGARGLQPAQLVMPLDTHVGQICQFVGLTRRKSLNWRAAVEITEALREVLRKVPEAAAASDPVRYDFALARIGIVDRCRKRFVQPICSRCELWSACRLARRRMKG